MSTNISMVKGNKATIDAIPYTEGQIYFQKDVDSDNKLKTDIFLDIDNERVAFPIVVDSDSTVYSVKNPVSFNYFKSEMQNLRRFIADDVHNLNYFIRPLTINTVSNDYSRLILSSQKPYYTNIKLENYDKYITQSGKIFTFYGSRIILGGMTLYAEKLNGSDIYESVISVGTGNFIKKFNFNDDGSFIDGNGVSTTFLNEKVRKGLEIVNFDPINGTLETRTIV